MHHNDDDQGVTESHGVGVGHRRLPRSLVGPSPRGRRYLSTKGGENEEKKKEKRTSQRLLLPSSSSSLEQFSSPPLLHGGDLTTTSSPFSSLLLSSSTPSLCLPRRSFTKQRESSVDITTAAMEEVADMAQTSVNMETLLKTGYGHLLKDKEGEGPVDKRARTIIQVATFLHREMPVRFAHRARELSRLPHGLAEMPSIQKVLYH